MGKLFRLSVLLLVVPLLVVPACVTGASAGPPVSEALLRDAEAYAEDQGIPLDEAVRQLRLQDPIGELNAVLQEREADVFGGLWIEHEPEHKVVLLLTGEQRRIRRRYVEGGPLEDEVEVREADATLEELQAAQTATINILAEVGSRADTGIGVQQNCVSLYVANPEALQAKLDAAAVVLPEHVCIVPTGPYAEAPPLNPPPGIVFPRQHPPEGLRVEMQALLIGELMEEDGCLRIGEEDDSHLVIWPYDHTVTATEGGTIQIRDGGGTVVARVGDIVRLSGGEAPAAEGLATIDVPDRCGGPYWIAGSEIESVNLEELPNHEDVAPVLRELRSRGHALEGPEESQAPFLHPEPGIAYRLGEGNWLHLHLFPNEQVARVRADTIGYEMPNAIIDWVAPPHVYRCGRVIALYLGTDEDVQEALAQQCDLIAEAPGP